MPRPPTTPRLPTPPPALQREGDALLRALIDAPEADRLPFLVYADWQDDHGRPEHAELIRVMCALEDNRGRAHAAEKKRLLARVRELLATSALAPLRRYQPNLRGFRRGFLDPLTLRVASEPPDPREAFLGPGHFDAPAYVPFDAVLRLALQFHDDEYVVGHTQELAGQPWLSRVTDVSFMWAKIDRGALRPFLSADLSGLTSLVLFDSKCDVGEVAELVNHPAAAGLRSLNLHTRRRTDLARLLRLVLDVPTGARFRDFCLHEASVTEQAARVLLDSPHLGELTQLSLFRCDLRPETFAALRERFGRAVRH